MRGHFPGEYQPTEREFGVLWRDGIIALDANLLLNMYRYSPATRAGFLGLLSKLREQLWLPHQAAREFFGNRLDIVDERLKLLSTTRGQLKGAKEGLGQLFRLPVQASEKPEEVESAWAALFAYLDHWEADAIQPSSDTEKDPVLKALTEIFEGRVGEPYSDEECGKICEQGRERYSARIPPGFSDADKPEPGRYGDLILWHQLIDRAKSAGKPAILVTGDEKDDWWRKVRGQTVGPQPALVQEMLSEAGQQFYMYKPDRFADVAGQFVEQRLSEQAIAEVRSTRPPRLLVPPRPPGWPRADLTALTTALAEAAHATESESDRVALMAVCEGHRRDASPSRRNPSGV